MNVHLRPVDADSRRACVALGVREDQVEFVSSNLECLDEAGLDDRLQPLAILAGERVVGMIVIAEPHYGVAVIHHVMIDAAHQGRGYGRGAVEAALEDLRSRSDCEAVELSYWPPNPASRLYEAIGFRHTGELWGDEPVMRLELREPPPARDALPST